MGYTTSRVSNRKDEGRLAKPKKQRFELQENESIDECLERMKMEGYFPVRRMAKPIFKEVKNGGQIEYIPVARQIIFEGKLIN
mgnify:CR=1 FL=1